MFFRTMGGALWSSERSAVSSPPYLSRSFPPDVVGKLLSPERGSAGLPHLDAPGTSVAFVTGTLASGVHLLFMMMAGGSVVALAASLLFPRTEASKLPGASGAAGA